MQLMLAQIQRVAFLDDDMAVFVLGSEVVLHHCKSLIGRYDDGFVIDLHEIGDIGRMIRFHVLDDEIVRGLAVETVLQIVEPFMRKVLIDGIHDGDLVIEDQIGIVGHAVGDFVLSLKEVDLMIVDADVSDSIGDFHNCVLLN